MANNETSLNENLVAAGLNTSNPQSTYVDFAEQIAKNQAEQASQEQALLLAKEHVKQAQFENKYRSPDSMTPQEAAQYLKIVAQAKGLEIDQASIDAWVKTLPEHVNRQVVESFANRFARESTRSGQPVKFDMQDRIAIPAGSTAEDLGLVADEADPKYAHVPSEGMYQVVYDNQGEIKKFIPGGKEAADPSLKLDAKMAESTEKQWQKLDSVINGMFKTRSGGLGSLSTALFRSVRAINTLTSTENLTAQDLANVAQDVAGIFQGGSPTVVTARDNEYKLTLLELKDWFRAQTGVLVNVEKFFGQKHNPLGPTKEKLLQVCVDLRDSAIANMKSFVESEAPAFKQIIEDSPERWEDFQAKKIKFIESGLLIPPGANTDLNITGMKDAQETKDPKKKTTEKSAKSSGTKLPSVDEIDAELAKRNAGKK